MRRCIPCATWMPTAIRPRCCGTGQLLLAHRQIVSCGPIIADDAARGGTATKGGETQFANTALAYAALPSATQQQIAGLRAVHSWEASRINCGGRPATEERSGSARPSIIPWCARIPTPVPRCSILAITHRTCWACRKKKARTLLVRSQEHATQAAFVYTHRWQSGDLVLWDNRCLLHRALPHEDMGCIGECFTGPW